MQTVALIRHLVITATALVATVNIAAAAGALAIGNCSRNGFAFNHPTQQIANKRALDECGKNGDATCKVVVTLRKNCGAFAAAGNCARGWAWAGTRAAAEKTALAQCAGHRGDKCSIISWVCDARG